MLQPRLNLILKVLSRLMSGCLCCAISHVSTFEWCLSLVSA